jgi:glutamate synthase domain-containing protein 2
MTPTNHRSDDPTKDKAKESYPCPAAKVVGEYRNRRKKFRPASIVNISGMSYGSLSGAAVEAMNRGCAIAGCMQATGEGGVSSYHQKGGDLIWQVGTGYFGCRNRDGSFSLDRLVEQTERLPTIKAIEIKLSQGAKPGMGGLLPKAKITSEIAEIRGIPTDRDCVSPPAHTAFTGVDSMLDFVELIAEKTGLPVGIKSAVGMTDFWIELADRIAATGRSVDFITIDGGEGGTGAAPPVFSDHVALPFKIGFTRVFKIFAEKEIQRNISFVGSGKLGLPESALFAVVAGCDWINVGREAMLAIGCIQAQQCHTGHCPTGVATQNKWLVAGLDPTLKSARLANYVVNLRRELIHLAHACGQAHPSLVDHSHIEFIDDRFGSKTFAEVFGYAPQIAIPSAADVSALSDDRSVAVTG